jgi:predicted ribosomally synthesized peptide with nif11-like leader
MSQAHAQKFYEIVAKDPALLESLGEGTNSSDEFLAKAVAAAKTQGLEFTVQEARHYVEKEMAKSKDGELSDQQLEAVAGGKVTVKITLPKKCTQTNVDKAATYMIISGYSWAW